MAEKKKKWLRFRHKIVRNIVYIMVKPVIALKYHAKIHKLGENKERQYLILFNHQTGFDQFFVGVAFKRPVYYVASEDIFSNGLTSSLIKYLVAPIPIKKQATDVRAVMNCIKVAKEGGTIAMAPEGNRTYSGQTEYIAPQIAPLARKLGLPIALYHIKGGYGVHPRWADTVRRGGMECGVSRIIEPEEYASLSDDELIALIRDGLYINEAADDREYSCKGLAEHLERAMYYCPYHGLSTFKSSGDIIECLECHRRIRYLKNKRLEGVGFDFPYRFVLDWYGAQSDFVNELDTALYTEDPIWIEQASFSEVIPYERKVRPAESAEISLYGDRIRVVYGDADTSFPFASTSAVTVLGKNKVNIYSGGKQYQIKGDASFNALKFVNMYNRHKNILKGEENVRYLGI